MRSTYPRPTTRTADNVLDEARSQLAETVAVLGLGEGTRPGHGHIAGCRPRRDRGPPDGRHPARGVDVRRAGLRQGRALHRALHGRGRAAASWPSATACGATARLRRARRSRARGGTSTRPGRSSGFPEAEPLPSRRPVDPGGSTSSSRPTWRASSTRATPTRSGHGWSSRVPTARRRAVPTGSSPIWIAACSSAPDILANAGGVVVSYFEWVQANQAFWWTEAEVEERLARRMSLVWQRTNQFASQHGVPLRTAATSLAVNAVADAHRMRGLYP